MQGSRLIIWLAATSAVLVASGAILSRQPAGAQAEELEPSEIFAQVAPAISIVESATGSGTGVLIDAHHVLTAAHVVGTSMAVDVRFPDGSEFLSSRVAVVDVMADLAVVELVSAAAARPVTVGDPTALSIGSEVLLIGYAGGIDEEVLEPTITRGLISRFRRWDAIDMTYVSTDALTVGGVSGGALVSMTGDVVGVPQYGRQGFGLASSAARALERVNVLLAGGTLDGLDGRTIPRQGGSQSFTVTFSAAVLLPTYAVSARVGSAVTVRASSLDDAVIWVWRADGLLVEFADRTTTGSEEVSFRIEDDTQYLVQFLVLASGAQPQLEVTSTSPLASVDDPDDGAEIQVGSRIAGAIDHAQDIDAFFVDLEAGKTVTVNVDSIAIDPVAWISAAEFMADELEYDDDSGGGLSGLNAEFEFTPSTTGRYAIYALDWSGEETGGYFVTVGLKDSEIDPARPGTIISGAVPSSGFGLIVFGGGTNSELTLAAGCPADRLLFYVPIGEEWVVFIPLAPNAVNAAWNDHFTGGIPANTPLVAQCRAP